MWFLGDDAACILTPRDKGFLWHTHTHTHTDSCDEFCIESTSMSMNVANIRTKKCLEISRLTVVAINLTLMQTSWIKIYDLNKMLICLFFCYLLPVWNPWSRGALYVKMLVILLHYHLQDRTDETFKREFQRCVSSLDEFSSACPWFNVAC